MVKTSKDVKSVVEAQNMLKYFLVHENDLYHAYKMIIEIDVFKVFQKPIRMSIYRVLSMFCKVNRIIIMTSLILLRGLKISDGEL